MSENFKKETLLHMSEVGLYMGELASMITDRGELHDRDKLIEPELSMFINMGHQLSGLVYGSDEYKKELELLKPAIQHHYLNNPHHPEHFSNGISGMTLVDLVELFCDWKSASTRTAGGTFEKSMGINAERFDLPDVLVSIFNNTHRMLSDG